MSREFKFFIYLLERYAAHRGETADVTYNLLSRHNAVDYAIDMYELYHVENLDNAFSDLDRKVGIAKEKIALHQPDDRFCRFRN